MTREQQTTITITCDGCGQTVQAPSAASAKWRTMRITARPVTETSLEPISERDLDLCPRCIDQVTIPGLNKPSI